MFRAAWRGAITAKEIRESPVLTAVAGRRRTRQVAQAAHLDGERRRGPRDQGGDPEVTRLGRDRGAGSEREDHEERTGRVPVLGVGEQRRDSRRDRRDRDGEPVAGGESPMATPTTTELVSTTASVSCKWKHEMWTWLRPYSEVNSPNAA